MRGIKRFLGQLRALWDGAGQLVELREEFEGLKDWTETEINRLDERTRKQTFRERQAAPVATGAPPAPTDGNSLIDARRIARERGFRV